MIELSFTKLLVLALIALIVLGPEKLPVVARTAGALIRRVRGGWDTVRAEVERELEVEEIRRTAREVVEQKDKVEAELKATLKQVKDVAGVVTTGKVTLPTVGAHLAAMTHDKPADTQGKPASDAAAQGTATAAGDAAVDAPIIGVTASRNAEAELAETQVSASPEPRHGSL